MEPTLGYIGHRPCLTQKRFTYAYRQFNSSASSLFALLVFSPEFLFSFVATFAHWLAHKVRVINLMFTRCNSSLITTIKLNQVNNGILTNREPGNNIYPPPLAVNKISPAQGHSADFILNWIWAWIRLIYNENAWYTCFECFAKKKKKEENAVLLFDTDWWYRKKCAVSIDRFGFFCLADVWLAANHLLFSWLEFFIHSAVCSNAVSFFVLSFCLFVQLRLSNDSRHHMHWTWKHLD